LNATPSTTDAVSPESTTAGVVDPRIVQGQGNEGATGVTAFEGAEAGLEPTALFAVTLKVYEVPLLSPVTVADTAGGDPLTVVAG
jgi:hypothetical protein